MKNTFPLILLLSFAAHLAATTKTCQTCVTKESVATTSYKVRDDMKEGIDRAKKDVTSIKDRTTLSVLAKNAESERTEAAQSVKVATTDTAYAVKEAAKAKFQNVKSEMALHKAESSRAKAAQKVKHAAADTGKVFKKKALVEAEIVKTTVNSTVDRAKEAFHHARAEHNKKAAQRHTKAAIEDTNIALQEEAKALRLCQS